MTPRQAQRKAYEPTPFLTGATERGHQTLRAGRHVAENSRTATTAAYSPCDAPPAPHELLPFDPQMNMIR